MLLYNKTMGNFINIDFIHNIISFFISKKNESHIDNGTRIFAKEQPGKSIFNQYIISFY